MNLSERINAFIKLGDFFRQLGNAEGSTSGLSAEERFFLNRLDHIREVNPWFDTTNILHAFRALGEVMDHSAFSRWLQHYPELDRQLPSRKIGVVMAGNIPLAGFHDFMSVLISGNIFLGKASTKDGGLHKTIAEKLMEIEPGFRNYITFTDKRFSGIDAVIATGSDNSARYFSWHYRDIPSLIRHNMNSLAILSGKETPEQLSGLADDIFLYYGLGCRSVSALMVPDKYDLAPLIRACKKYREVMHHQAYRHNLVYQRSILNMEKTPYTDGGNLLILPDTGLASPIGMLYKQTYSSRKSVESYLAERKEHLQCVVADPEQWPGSVSFGKAQYPALDDYADRKDTLRFLLSGIHHPS